MCADSIAGLDHMISSTPKRTELLVTFSNVPCIVRFTRRLCTVCGLNESSPLMLSIGIAHKQLHTGPVASQRMNMHTWYTQYIRICVPCTLVLIKEPLALVNTQSQVLATQQLAVC